VTISNITDAHVLMSSALHCDNSVVIDIDDVTDADLTFVQLIEAARRSMAERGRSIRLLHAADGAVAQVLRRGGFLDPADAERADFWLQGTSKQ
jgi:anti-anti-sigma regulatory factor